MLTVALAAHAGHPCVAHTPTTDETLKGLTLAERTSQALAATGAQVVVLARAGQDLTEYGLHWSHLGYAYRDDSAPEHPWRIVHKLNECGTDHAALYRQGLADFFMDSPWRYEAAIVVLSPEAQRALLPILQDNARAATLNTPAYSVVAYPWAQRYQQSNQWAIETLAMAMQPSVTSRVRAQGWLQAEGYEPTTLHLSALKRLGADLTAANVAFDDHPNARRFANQIDTVTVESVFAFLRASGLGGDAQVVR